MSGGSGSDGDLSKLGIALVIIFAISLLAIFAQVFYVLWRRLVFHRRTVAADCGGGDEVSRYSSTESDIVAPSKELLYYLCMRPQLRLDRSSLTANSGGDERNLIGESDTEVIDIDLLKIQGVFEPPRFLFTIKEEEMEDVESPAKKAPFSAEIEPKKIGGDEKRGSMCLEECFRSTESTTVEVDEIDDDATPFWTPCASPLYFTPSASPVHEVVNGRSATTLAV